MKGSIRVFIGLLTVLFSAGGLDTAADSDLLPIVAVAALGLGIMYSGVTAMKRGN